LIGKCPLSPEQPGPPHPYLDPSVGGEWVGSPVVRRRFMAQEVSLVSWALSVTDVDCRDFVPAGPLISGGGERCPNGRGGIRHRTNVSKAHLSGHQTWSMGQPVPPRNGVILYCPPPRPPRRPPPRGGGGGGKLSGVFIRPKLSLVVPCKFLFGMLFGVRSAFLKADPPPGVQPSSPLGLPPLPNQAAKNNIFPAFLWKDIRMPILKVWKHAANEFWNATFIGHISP